MKLRSGLWFGENLDAVRAEAVRCHYPLYELSMNGTPDRESFFTAVRSTLPQDPVLVSSRSWDALVDSVRNGIGDARGNRHVVVWPDLREFEDPLGVSVLEQVIWHLETWRPANYLCIYAD
ncbi:hypothetical protein ABZX92_24060 [Lentzea sp. NPDC006480]|uniref:hypothetical protein n=1 Tax=Lentzea sp. NPDC006480 TaxID=3157176 RepID=UPI0033A12429